MEEDQMLKWFKYEHLPYRLQLASKPFHDLAQNVVGWFAPSAERTVCLRKLLEAKDAAVRAFIETDPKVTGK